jgi:dethiobiotin synthetase
MQHNFPSINHTMLSLELLKNYDIPLKTLIWIGGESASELATEKIILSKYPQEKTFKIPIVSEVNQEFIVKQADKLMFNL